MRGGGAHVLRGHNHRRTQRRRGLQVSATARGGNGGVGGCQFWAGHSSRQAGTERPPPRTHTRVCWEPLQAQSCWYIGGAWSGTSLAPVPMEGLTVGEACHAGETAVQSRMEGGEGMGGERALSTGGALARHGWGFLCACFC